MLEVRTQGGAPESSRTGEKRTIFGFALATLGIERNGEGASASATDPASAPPPSAAAAPGVAIGRVAGVGGPSAPSAPRQHDTPAPMRDARDPVLKVTAPQYRAATRAHPTQPPERVDGQRSPFATPASSPVYAAPSSPAMPAAYAAPAPAPSASVMPSAPVVHTPPPAYLQQSVRSRFEAETHELPPTPSAGPPSTLEMDSPYDVPSASAPHGHVDAHAPTAAERASVASRAPSPAPLEGPDARTAFVDVRALAAQRVALPEVRGAEPRSSHQTDAAPTGSHAEASPRGVARFPRGFRAHKQQESVDLDRVLGRVPRRTLLLVSISAVVVLLAGLSFLAKSSPEQRAQLGAVPASVTARARARESQGERAPREVRGELAGSAQPLAADKAAAPDVRAPAAASATPSAEERVRAAEQPQPAARAEHGSATPERAAILYIEGKYKQALAEYRLLAAAHPEQRVYAELARILRRKIVDTCLRTQPNRREQCRAL